MKKNIMNERLSISSTSPLRARFYDYKHFSYPWHFHSEYEIMYVREGTGTRFVGNSFDKFSAGDIILFGSNLPHYMKSDEQYHTGGSPLRVRGTIIQFEREFMYYSISHYPHLAKVRNLLEESANGLFFPAGCSRTMPQLLDEIPRQTGIDQFISFLRLLREMSSVRSRQVISAPARSGNPRYESSRIDKITSYINKNYTRCIELEEVSSLAAMNPSAFCRFFKRATGKSLKQYISDMRIGYACKLLLMDDISISQVSAQCGFDTISHFNKTFKRNIGHAPSQYRKIML